MIELKTLIKLQCMNINLTINFRDHKLKKKKEKKEAENTPGED